MQIRCDPLLQEATGKQLVALARCGWGGDYPADDVTEFAAGYDSLVADMFKYISMYNKEHIGFECHVDNISAMAWLRLWKPKIHLQILKALTEVKERKPRPSNSIPVRS